MVSKQERLEKKKRKIVALANIIKINENDKMEQSKKASEGENSGETTIEIVSEETVSSSTIMSVSILKDIIHFF